MSLHGFTIERNQVAEGRDPLLTFEFGGPDGVVVAGSVPEAQYMPPGANDTLGQRDKLMGAVVSITAEMLDQEKPIRGMHERTGRLDPRIAEDLGRQFGEFTDLRLKTQFLDGFARSVRLGHGSSYEDGVPRALFTSHYPPQDQYERPVLPYRDPFAPRPSRILQLLRSR